MSSVFLQNDQEQLRRVRQAALSGRSQANIFLRWFRSCAMCASTQPPVDFLCAHCWDTVGEVAARGSGLKPKSYPFPVASLLSWTDESDSWLRPVIHSFKRGLFPRAAFRLAGLHWNHRVKSSRLHAIDEGKSGFAIVPAPGEGVDHASVWAEALGALYGYQILDVLIAPEKASSQRLKSAQERSERRYRLRPGFEPSPETRYIFVDDVITTGATAMAAYMALGDPNHFEVWTLVSRPRLAGFDAL